MHKTESVLEKKIHKILWDFDEKTDNLISSKKSDQVIIN